MGLYVQKNGQWQSVTVDAALKLNTPRSIALTGDVSGSTVFDGSANVTIVTKVLSAASGTNDSEGNPINTTYLKRTGGTMTGALNCTNIIPGANNAYTLGTSSNKFQNIYANNISGNLTGNVVGNVTGNVSGSSGSCTGTAENANSIRNIVCDTTATVPTGTSRLNMNCYLYATRIYNSVFNDYAECFDNSDLTYEDVKSKIVEIDDNGKLILANELSNLVVGVVSNNYGQLLGGTEEDILNGYKLPIGLAGVLYVVAKDTVSKADRGKFAVSGGDGLAIAVQYPEYGTSVGKIIDIDIENNMYKIVLSLM